MPVPDLLGRISRLDGDDIPERVVLPLVVEPLQEVNDPLIGVQEFEGLPRSQVLAGYVLDDDGPTEGKPASKLGMDADSIDILK